MRFRTLEHSLRCITLLRQLLPTVRKHDPKLAGHLRDAGSSIALNLAEGNRRQGRDRIHLWNVASGSAEEVRTALRVAMAWGYVTAPQAAAASDKLDHVVAVLYKLTRRR